MCLNIKNTKKNLNNTLKNLNKKQQKMNYYNNCEYFTKRSLGFLIFKGNKNYAIKLFNNLIYNLKNEIKGKPLFIILDNYLKLKPFFDVIILDKKRNRTKVQISTLKRKNFLSFKWLFKAPKLIGSTRSVNLKDLIQNLKDFKENKGISIEVRNIYLKYIFKNYTGLNIGISRNLNRQFEEDNFENRQNFWKNKFKYNLNFFKDLNINKLKQKEWIDNQFVKNPKYSIKYKKYEKYKNFLRKK